MLAQGNKQEEDCSLHVGVQVWDREGEAEQGGVRTKPLELVPMASTMTFGGTHGGSSPFSSLHFSCSTPSPAVIKRLIRQATVILDDAVQPLC